MKNTKTAQAQITDATVHRDSNVKKLLEFINTHYGHIPQKEGETLDFYIRSMVNDPCLTPSVKTPMQITIHDNVQFTQMRDIIKFIDKNGRKPSMTSNDAKEKRLGNVLHQMRLGMKHMQHMKKMNFVNQMVIRMVKNSDYRDLLDIKKATPKGISKPSTTSLKKVHTQIDKLAKKAGMPDLFKPKKRK